ncbi:MAG: hypothetical protein KF900_06880 [Bacteroidetes bacterium]|nr:hypothetical protein [Bacteroidota bacterium]
MVTKQEELHNYLKSIDFSTFRADKKYKIDVNENILKYLRNLGTEFDRTLKKIILKINTVDAVDSVYARIQHDLFQSDKRLLPVKFSREFQSTYDKSFNLAEFIESYNFQEAFHYGINNEVDKKLCQDYLTNLLLKIDLEKFKAKKVVFTNFNFANSNLYNSGCIDLIVDDKIIDIKTDIEIGAIPNRYISQLLYYYIFVKYIITSNKVNNTNVHFKKLNINKVCLYYANFDLLIEFDIKKFIPNEKKLLALMNNELIYGNRRIRDITDNSRLNKKFDNEYFKKINHEIIQRRQNELAGRVKGLIISNNLNKAKQIHTVLCREFPKHDLTITLSVFLNFLLNQDSSDRLLIRKKHQLLSDWVEKTQNEYEELLVQVNKNISEYLIEYNHLDNEELFQTSLLKSKSYHQFLNNLEHFDIYIDFYKYLRK